MADGPSGGLLVANFNVHCGVDGWAHRFDVAKACAVIGADVLVMQENWAPDGERSVAADVGDSLGYEVVEVELARAGVLDEDPVLARPSSPQRWAPSPYRRDLPRALLLEGSRRRGSLPARRPAARRRRPGSWGLAVLSRVGLRRVEVIELRPLSRDPAQRRAIVAEVDGGITVAGVHLAHLEHGSVLQMRQLAGELGRRGGPIVLAGDMNSWTLPLLAMLPGWRKGVHGRTWPTGHPHSQIDHLLVNGELQASDGEVLGPLGSDHRPIRARVTPR